MASSTVRARGRWLPLIVGAVNVASLLFAAGPVAAAPNFQLLIEPPSQLLPPGGSVSFQVQVGSIEGFDEPVSLEVGTLPAGVTSLLSHDLVTPPAVATLTLIAAEDAVTGSFPLTITGTGGGMTNVASGSVTVDFGLVPACSGLLQGTVTDVETGVPIEGAEVNGAQTDVDGKWGPIEVPLGENNSPLTTSIFARQDGYWDDLDFATAYCDQTTVVDFTLLRWRPASIAGTVVEGTPDSDDPTVVIPDGAALDDVTVSTQFYPAPTGGGFVTTGADGQYRIDLQHVSEDNEPVLDLNLRASRDGYWDRDATSPSPIRTGDLAADEDKVVPVFGMVKTCSASLTGTVVYGDTGEPASGITVRASHTWEFKTTTTDAAGTFDFSEVLLGYNNQPVEFGVGADGNDFYRSATDTVAIDSCGDAGSVTLTLEPNSFGSVEGFVTDKETGLPVAGVMVGPLFGCGPCMGNPGTTDTTGYYRIEDLPVDFAPSVEYPFLTLASGYWRADGTVEVFAGQTARLDLEILAHRFARVTGTVTDAITGDPIQDATVNFAQPAVTNADGSYESGDLLVGTNNEPLMAGFQAGADGYWPQGRSVTLEADTTATLDYELIPICDGASVRGTVIDAITRLPIPGAAVSASGGGFDLTDDAGIYLLENLMVGVNNSPISVSVTASADGYHPQSRTVTLFCGGSLTIEFGPTPPFADVEGSVTCGGEPMASVLVEGEWGELTTTDAEGYYLLEEGPLHLDGTSREWNVFAIADGGEQEVRAVTLTSEGRARLDIAFDCGDPPQVALSVEKTATPQTLTEPGGDVSFAVRVENAGEIPLRLASLVDDAFGDLNGQGDCVVPQDVVPGGAYACTFTGLVEANAGADHLNVVTACAIDTGGIELCADAEASVVVSNGLPVLAVEKTANPSVLADPGGPVSFGIRVSNESAATDPVTLTAMVDSAYGDVTGASSGEFTTTCELPQVIDPGGEYQCSFTATVLAAEGPTHSNVIEVCAADDEGSDVCASDDATVTFVDSGHLAPTGTECVDYATGIAASQDELGYHLKGTKINAVNPGVFLYWSSVQAPASSFEIAVTQTALTEAGAPGVPPLIKVSGTSKLFDSDCERIPIRLTRAPTGQVVASVTGAEVGATYYFTVKYDSQSLARTTVSTSPAFVARYEFTAGMNGEPISGTKDALTLRRH